MIDHLTIHIGHQKTGTSSLQATLRASAPMLADHGLFYFARVRNHNPVACAFHRKTRAQKYLQARRELQQALRRTRGPRALVSSELLVRLTDDEAERCVAWFARLARRVDVLIYVRHPVSFASSAAGQGVRSGKPLAQSIRSPRVLPLREIIGRWQRAAGRDNVTVRPFARPLMVRGDVIDDVCTVLGLASATPQLSRVQVNEALSAFGVELLDRAQRIEPRRRLPESAWRAFEAIDGPRYVLPAASLDDVRRRSRPELAYLSEEFGIVLPEPDAVPTPPPDLDEATLQSLAAVIYASSRYAHKVDRSLMGRLLYERAPYAAEDEGKGGGNLIHPLIRRLGAVRAPRPFARHRGGRRRLRIRRT